jgi:hypothetical protein
MIFKLIPPGQAHPSPGPLTPATAKHPALITADISPKIAIFGLISANAVHRGAGLKLTSIGEICFE